MRCDQMADTSIEWTDATWNPVAGCTVITAGCTNCYAMRMAARLEAMGMENTEASPARAASARSGPARSGSIAAALDIPVRWKKPRRIFVNSMSDLFHEAVPASFRSPPSGETMQATPQHTYQILTKRPDRMARFSGAALLRTFGSGTRVERCRRARPPR